MKKENIFNTLVEVQRYYYQKKQSHYIMKCQEEHLQDFANNLEAYFNTPCFIEKFTIPSFEEEVKIDRILCYETFSFLKEDDTLLRTAKQFLETKVEAFLIVLGQRLTPATLRNENAFPPIKKEVFNASFTAYNTQVTKAVRAFEKHSERTNTSFWGKIAGNPKEKEEKVKQIIHHILENKTWWNVFYHFKHELIYEVRIASGQGVRWKKDTLDFIGFVEPFIN